MAINPGIFKSYDIRGVYPTDINEETVVTVSQAIYAFLLKKLGKESITIAVGHDMRVSAPTLYPILLDTLVKAGAHVVDLGLVSTPTFYFAVWNYKYETGLQLTASHNPKEWNGMKFVINSPEGLIKVGKPTGMEEVKELAISGNIPLPTVPQGHVEEKTGILEDEVDNALKVLDNPTVKTFTVVADPANAMGGTYIDAFFKKVPSNLIKMNFELDGTFPAHQPDPLQFDLLKDLQKRVIEEKADLGLAPDGDGDRLFFIDEKGQVIPGTIITALVAKEFLKKYPGETILFDLRNILTPRRIVEENGGKWQMTKVGHANITDALNKGGGIFAGEGSGHFYYRATGGAESQVITMLCVLSILTEENKPLSEIVKELKRSFESGEINYEVHNAAEIIAGVKAKYADGELSELDGISITYPDWRFNVRTSNTEPLLRLNVEAETQEVMDGKRDELVALITSLKK